MRVFSGFIISLYNVSVLAAEPRSLNRVNTPSDAALQQGYEEQNRALQRQQEQTQVIQSQQVKQPEVHFQTEAETTALFTQPEAQCLPISELYLTDLPPSDADLVTYTGKDNQPPKNQFNWALEAVYTPKDFSLPHCIGGEGIGILIKRIQNAIIEKRFVTTRVLVQPQDLRSGKLILTVIPGRINRIQLRDNSDSPKATLVTSGRHYHSNKVIC